jgi:uncharacterized protein (TIGR01777 family)
MNYLIAGGSGLIGSALTKVLADQKHKVTIVSRNPGRLTGLSDNVDVISWETNALISALNTTHAVINLAGASISGNNPLLMRWTKKRKAEIINSRLQAGKFLGEALSRVEHKPEVLLQASAIGFYGNTGSGLIDETSGPGSDFLAEVCQGWEESSSGIEELGIRRIITRIGLVFSPRGGLLDLLKFPFRFYAGGQIGTGQQYLSWIHIHDLVNGIIFLIGHPQARGVYNLTAPRPARNQDFARTMGSVLKKPVWFRVPAAMLRIALGEAATLALDGRPVLPQRLLDSGYNFVYDQLESALVDLLAEPQSV